MYYMNGEKYVEGKAKVSDNDYIFTDEQKIWFHNGNIKTVAQFNNQGLLYGIFRKYSEDGDLRFDI